MMARTIIELLAQLPKEHLARMRNANRVELERAQAYLQRLEIEKSQLDAALKQHDVQPVAEEAGKPVEGKAS